MRPTLKALSKSVLALLTVFGVLLAGTVSAGALDPPPGVVVPVPSSVDASGGSDVSGPLGSFLAGVADGSTVVFPVGGRYRVESGLALVGGDGLTIEGNGSTLFADSEGTLNRSILKIVRSSNVVVRDLVIRGANPQGGLSDGAYRSALEAQHGVQLNAVDGVVLERLVITDVYGDFVYIAGTGDKTWSRRVVVRNSVMSRNGRQGVAIVAAEDVLIERNTMSLMRRSVFDIEPNQQWGGARRVRISDNTIGAHRLLFMPVTGSTGAVIEDIEVSRNNLVGVLRVFVNPPVGARRARIAIVDNIAAQTFRSSATPLVFRRTDDVLVRGNRQRLYAGGDMTAVQLVDVCRAAVTGNDFTGAARVVVTSGTTCPGSAPVLPRPPGGIG